LLGILLEIAALFWFPSGRAVAEILLVLGANVAIGVGLVIEFFCIHAAIRGNAELKIESDARLADALTRAAAAQEELVKFRTPRATLLTDAARTLLLERLRPFQGTIFVIGHDNLDREVWDFLWVLEPIISEAGWIHSDWQGGQRFRKQTWPGEHWYGIANVMNVSIEVQPSEEAALLPAAEALAEALRAVSVDAVRAYHNNSSINTESVRLLVGPKR
jgi:hypothetical protein